MPETPQAAKERHQQFEEWRRRVDQQLVAHERALFGRFNADEVVWAQGVLQNVDEMKQDLIKVKDDVREVKATTQSLNDAAAKFRYWLGGAVAATVFLVGLTEAAIRYWLPK